MPSWQPDLYLTFRNERTQPSIDLVSRIDHQDPKTIIDIGCGPGNSTMVLKKRWPQACLIGLDSSEAMITEARMYYPGTTWLLKDASDDLSELGCFDIVFSNAAIQWIPNQEQLLQKLYGMLNKNGVLAVQVPNARDLPVHTELVKLAASEKWQGCFEGMVSPYSVHQADFYYDILCNLTDKLDLWETDYYHVMNNYLDIVNWSSGSALRPYLEYLQDASAAAEFNKEYGLLMKDAYPVRPNGKTVVPFTRLFFVVRN